MCPEIVLEDDEVSKMITCEMLIKDSKKNETHSMTFSINSLWDKPM